MMDEFKEYCRQLNQKCSELQNLEKEYVTHEYAFMALAYVKNMILREVGDLFLYCAALNLLNTYVKQKDNQIGYGFKRELSYLISIALNIDIAGVRYDLQMDGRNPLLVILFEPFQFSFHNITMTKELKKLTKDSLTIEWDGIRKQKCAVTIFKDAEKNMIARSGITFRGKNLSKKIDKLMENFRSGKMKMSDLT